MTNVTEIFGSLVFNDTVMKERLPEEVYTKLKSTIDSGEAMSLETANVVEDWDVGRLNLGEAIVMLNNSAPFKFGFKEFISKK